MSDNNVNVVGLLFFLKQRTEYDVRISDWSSDVCSSDLISHELRDNQRNGFQNLQHQRQKLQSLHPLSRKRPEGRDRQSVAKGKRVSVGVGVGGRRIITS